MSILLSISIGTNALLCLALVAVVRRYRSGEQFAEIRLRREREAAETANEGLKQLSSEYCALAEAVSTSLEAIREDIDRNYHHTHDGHVLDTIAYRLRREVTERRTHVYEIPLDEDSAKQVNALGGVMSSRHTMSLGQMLAFGWRLHELSRERSDQLTDVVRQPCGNREHAGWLGKVLAIYELMCDRDRELAIERFAAAIEAWRHVPAQFAGRYVEDVR